MVKCLSPCFVFTRFGSQPRHLFHKCRFQEISGDYLLSYKVCALCRDPASLLRETEHIWGSPKYKEVYPLMFNHHQSCKLKAKVQENETLMQQPHHCSFPCLHTLWVFRYIWTNYACLWGDFEQILIQCRISWKSRNQWSQSQICTSSCNSY